MLKRVRIGARAGVAGLLAAFGLLSLGELAGQLLLADQVTPQRLAALAVAVLAVVAAGCVAAAVRVDRAPAAIPVVRSVTALRDKSWRVAFLRLRDPGARGRSEAKSAVGGSGGRLTAPARARFTAPGVPAMPVTAAAPVSRPGPGYGSPGQTPSG